MLPDCIRDVEHLDDLLSEPSPQACEALANLPGDLLFLGVGGKMGPTLARMARRASDLAGVRRRVYGAARFSQPELEGWLRKHGVEPLRCDLLDPAQLAQLPEVENVVFMTGRKFGSTGDEGLTWAMNCHLPSLVCQRFHKSRIAAFSSGNIYGMSPVGLGGSRESDLPSPVGEYGMSCLGRERMFEHFSRSLGIPVVLLRLNYATEMRYGVVVDVARRVYRGEPVPLAMGHFNAIWQGDANAQSLCALPLAQSPAAVLNLAGPETLSVRRLAESFGRLFSCPVQFEGEEATDALLSNSQRAQELFGYPRVSIPRVVRWVADWVQKGGASLGKPTHFESRAGRF